MSENKYAVSKSWQKKVEQSVPFDYTLEGSGQTCLVRKVDMSDIMAFGLVDDMDFLAKEMAEISSKDTGETKKATRRKNSKNMERIVNMIVQAAVIKPEIEMAPENDSDRIEGVIYVDSIPFTDRIELFSVVYDMDSLTGFREEQETSVGIVADVADVPLPADELLAGGPNESAGVLSESNSP